MNLFEDPNFWWYLAQISYLLFVNLLSGYLWIRVLRKGKDEK